LSRASASWTPYGRARSNGNAPYLKTVGQGFTFDVFDHEKIDAIVLADVKKDADMRMVETRDGLRLALESFSKLRVTGKVRGNNLDGDDSLYV